MQAKHTPGPWKAHLHRTAKQSRWQVWQDKAGQPMMGEYRIADEVTFEEDASLIAAAPDLLAVVQELFSLEDALLSDIYGSDFVGAARAAIKKALGDDCSDHRTE